ncbi:MAG: 4Fe-4S binding protein [Sedimenticola sp.]
MTDEIRHQAQIDPARCLLATTAISNCSSCIDACPKDAWILTDESIDLDENGCDGCGICTPVCPTGAVTVEGSVPLLLERNLLSLVCGDVTPYSALNRVECIHGIGLETLVGLYRDGMRRIRACIGACNDCSRSSNEGFWTMFMGFNNALHARELPMIVLEFSEKDCSKQEERASAPTDTARRGFFSKLFGRQAVGADDDTVENYADSPGNWLASSGFAGPLPHVPVIDLSACLACHACVRICPQQAIVHDQEASTYRLYAESCNGCRLCIDICEHGAIAVDSWSVQRQFGFDVVSKRCAACGVDFSLVQLDSEAEDRCHICRTSNRFNNLYQLID